LTLVRLGAAAAAADDDDVSISTSVRVSQRTDADALTSTDHAAAAVGFVDSHSSEVNTTRAVSDYLTFS
jgi:hypothetical protein